VAVLTEREFLELLRRTGALLEGHFLLSSGLHSPHYVQCARLLQHPGLAALACMALASKAARLEPFDVVIGPALGGIIVAYELGRALGVRGMFAEREEGKLALRRGFSLSPGERVLVAEDVVTTGRSSLEVAGLVAALGGTPVGVACLVDRRKGDEFPLPFVSLARLKLEAFPPEECPLCREGVPWSKPGSRPS